jgi:hypothetical protein
MKTAIIFILITLVHLRGTSQKDLINWSKDVKIKWSDFKGRADPYSPFAAVSAIGIHYKYYFSDKGKIVKIKFEIQSKFDKTKSWSRARYRTSNILEHEQLHFDISEVVKREFKKEAEKTVFSKNYKNEIIRIFNRYDKYLQKLQQKYDEQTKHSNDRVKQKKWKNLIYQELGKAHVKKANSPIAITQ